MGMAVAIDAGETYDIHPKDKLDVGHRLALAARRVAYGEDIQSSGPIHDGMQTEGNTIRIHFKHGQGLKIGAHPQIFADVPPTTAPTKLPAFAIAGDDRKWMPAKAVIDAETVIVSSDLVKAPVAVRYGWSKNPACFLYNAANLPASPFRTDDWSVSSLCTCENIPYNRKKIAFAPHPVCSPRPRPIAIVGLYALKTAYQLPFSPSLMRLTTPDRFFRPTLFLAQNPPNSDAGTGSLMKWSTSLGSEKSNLRICVLFGLSLPSRCSISSEVLNLTAGVLVNTNR